MIENLFESFHMQYQAGSARQQLNPLIIFVSYHICLDEKAHLIYKHSRF